MDGFAVPRPILYMRANPGARSGNTTIVYNSRVGSTFQPNFHYDIGSIVSYFNYKLGGPPTNYPPEKLDFLGQDPAGAPNATTQAYFAAPSGNSAINAGTFILISAGADRIFGTQDDIIVGGGGGQ
jgi:hypothetical protein